MNTITKQYRAEIAHRLINYEGKCAHLHGHSYLFELTVTAPDLDDRGMLVDFKDVKAAMKHVLEPYDHALVLHRNDPLIQLLDDVGTNIFVAARGTNNESARLHLWEVNPTAEWMAITFAAEIQDALPREIRVVRLRVWETATSFAEWTPEVQV